MPEKISWSLNVQIAGGPKLALSQNLEVEAYDKIAAVIPHGEEHEVDVQPGDATEVKFLAITSDLYDELLTYKPKDGTAGANAIELDAPQLFLGAGAVGLLEKAPKQLVFKNGHASSDATVQILVGRTVLTTTP